MFEQWARRCRPAILLGILGLLGLAPGTGFAQDLVPDGETTSFRVGTTAIELPTLSFVWESEECVRFYWEQYALIFNDMTVEEAEDFSAAQISNPFMESLCFSPMIPVDRPTFINTITQELRAAEFSIVTESGNEYNHIQWWSHDFTHEPLSVYFHTGDGGGILLMVERITPLGRTRMSLNDYLLEIAMTVDEQAMFDGVKDVASDCVASYVVGTDAYELEPPHPLRNCTVTLEWLGEQEYRVLVRAYHDEVGDLEQMLEGEAF